MSTDSAARLRMFAGPNGAGKSTIKAELPPELLGVYVNPDEMLRALRMRGGRLRLADYGAEATAEEARRFFRSSGLLEKAGLLGDVEALRFTGEAIGFQAVAPNAYHASVAASFVRHRLVEAGTSFTFETVMSSPDKVAFLEHARQRGYRTYLYYVAVDDPRISVRRVGNRVKKGGHPVPEDKIVSRYHRSLDLLLGALRHTDRAYVFDNSSRQPLWIAEVTGGEVVEVKVERIPRWFEKAVWSKL